MVLIFTSFLPHNLQKGQDQWWYVQVNVEESNNIDMSYKPDSITVRRKKRQIQLSYKLNFISYFSLG